MVDMFLEMVMLGGVLWFVAGTMEKKKFNYRYEGLRAIGPPFAHVQIIFRDYDSIHLLLLDPNVGCDGT
jgi:hypothetical protein